MRALGARPSKPAFGGLALLLFLGLGCAGRAPRPALAPSATGTDLIAAMVQEPRIGPFSSRLRLRIDVPNRRGVTLDGSVQAILPDTLRLLARFGVFRPIFALLADADSCELLLHQDGKFWTTSRDDVNWTVMNPTAWSSALRWALCPQDLLARLQPDHPASVQGDIWRISGPIRDAPYRGEVAVDVSRFRVRELKVMSASGLEVDARLGDYRKVGGREVPGFLEFRRPAAGAIFRVQLRGLSTLRRGSLPRPLRTRPEGWRPVRADEAPASLEETPSGLR